PFPERNIRSDSWKWLRLWGTCSRWPVSANPRCVSTSPKAFGLVWRLCVVPWTRRSLPLDRQCDARGFHELFRERIRITSIFPLTHEQCIGAFLGRWGSGAVEWLGSLCPCRSSAALLS